MLSRVFSDGFFVCLCSSMVERASEKGEKEVRFLPKAHALVAQWIEHADSTGKAGSSSLPEGTCALT